MMENLEKALEWTEQLLWQLRDGPKNKTGAIDAHLFVIRMTKRELATLKRKRK